MLFPLSVVITISMIKDIYEDYKRHKSDRTENERPVEVLNKESFAYEKKKWQDIKIGNIVKVMEG